MTRVSEGPAPSCRTAQTKPRGARLSKRDSSCRATSTRGYTPCYLFALPPKNPFIFFLSFLWTFFLRGAPISPHRSSPSRARSLWNSLADIPSNRNVGVGIYYICQYLMKGKEKIKKKKCSKFLYPSRTLSRQFLGPRRPVAAVITRWTLDEKRRMCTT